MDELSILGKSCRTHDTYVCRNESKEIGNLVSKRAEDPLFFCPFSKNRLKTSKTEILNLFVYSLQSIKKEIYFNLYIYVEIYFILGYTSFCKEENVLLKRLLLKQTKEDLS